MGVSADLETYGAVLFLIMLVVVVVVLFMIIQGKKMGIFGKTQGQACYKCGKVDRCWLKCHLCRRVVCQECDLHRYEGYHQKKYAQYVEEQESMRNYLVRRKQRYSRD